MSHHETDVEQGQEAEEIAIASLNSITGLEVNGLYIAECVTPKVSAGTLQMWVECKSFNKPVKYFFYAM